MTSDGARRTALRRARVLGWVAICAFGLAAVMAVVMMVRRAGVWWQWLILLALCGALLTRNAVRLRAIGTALADLEDDREDTPEP